MKHEQTIAIAQTLLAQGRAGDVVRMIEPLLGEEGEEAEPEALLLHGLLARVHLLSDQRPGRVFEGPLARYAAAEALASLPPRLRADVALWLGWASTFSGPHCDLPRALYLLRQAHLLFVRRLDVRGLLWSRIGQAKALAMLEEPRLAADALEEAALLQATLCDEQASAWLQHLGSSGHAESPLLPSVATDVRRLAATCCPVVLFGENGTGKTHLARCLHAARSGNEAPFVVFNPADSSDPSSASSSPQAARGLQAVLSSLSPGSTLFIDGVEHLAAEAQTNLLAFLRREGPSAERASIYVIAATCCTLEARVQSGAFDEALLHRLAVASAELAPLRERPFEAALLVYRFLRDLSPAAAPAPSITDRALQTLFRYTWPGNIRQLRNEIERALVFVGSEPLPVIDQRDLSGAVAPPSSVSPAWTSGQNLDDALAEAERGLIARALAAHEGQVTASARALGLTRQGLYKKMKRLGLDAASFQSGRPPEAAGPMLHLN